jgi:hypothetical protein
MDDSRLEWKITIEYQRMDGWYLLRVWERVNDEFGSGSWVCIMHAGCSANNSFGHSRRLLKQVIRTAFH